ncbi:MAG: TetR/AcrR family transcriptional regulator [Verrucomicrobiota bacterium]
MKKKPGARNRILDKATSLFFQRGYSEVGINEIIEESETAKATFYHHFPSKQALCEAWLSEVHDRSEGSREDILASTVDPVAKVRGYFEALRHFLDASRFRGCPYTNTAAVCSGEDQEKIIQLVEDHKEGIRDFFHQLATQVTPAPERSRKLGDTLFLLYSGATTEAQNLRSMWPVQAATDAALELCELERRAS